METKFETLLTSLDNGTLIITINRPDQMNALNAATLNDLESVFSQAGEDEKVKCIVLTGQGEKAFVAGADIKEFTALNAVNSRKFAERGQEVFSTIEGSPKPVIGAINGYALGGGCELALACHMRVGNTKAVFAQPEVNLGINPAYGGTQRLPQVVGKGIAFEMMLTGGFMKADRAYAVGLLNHVVEDQDLISKCKEIAKVICEKAPVALEGVINSTNALFEGGSDGYAVEANCISRCCGTEDFKEGVSAFIEKRSPAFEGK